jgi:hypothetical protein
MRNIGSPSRAGDCRCSVFGFRAAGRPLSEPEIFAAVRVGSLVTSHIVTHLSGVKSVKIALAAAHFYGFGVARQGPCSTWVKTSLSRTVIGPRGTNLPPKAVH